MRKLQITQGFDNIQTFYNQPSITWAGERAEFVINENEPTEAHLMVWLDGVTPEQIITELVCLERKIDQFLLAMQVMNNARMRKKGGSELKYTAKGGQEFLIEKNFLESIVNDILKYERGENWGRSVVSLGRCTVSSSATSPTVPFPETLPKIPLELERLISIFSSAENFSGDYREEHQLRNYCLILEELKHEGKILKSTFYDDLWQVRNFISHAKCHDKKLCCFIETNFPAAIIDKGGEKYAQFDRTQNSHISFICKYRDEAYQWVKQELAKELYSPVAL
jgi:hypothetical protein